MSNAPPPPLNANAPPPTTPGPTVVMPPADPVVSVSILPGAKPGVHELQIPPGTVLRGPPVYASIAVQLANAAPDVLAIAVFAWWGSTGVVSPTAAAGFITAFVVARMQPSRPGAGGTETIIRGAGDLALRMVGIKKREAPPP
jgi:hypothetical protein